MADSKAFDFVCGEIERGTSLDRLEARGTVRLALRDAGLDPRSVRPREMAVLLERILPGALEARGVAEGAQRCDAIRRGLAGIADDAGKESPEEVFRRLGGAAS